MGVSAKQQNVHFRVEYLFSIASTRGVNRHYFHDSIRLSCQRFDITIISNLFYAFLLNYISRQIF